MNNQKSYRTPLIFILDIIRSFKWLIAGQILVAIVWAVDISLRPYLIKIILNEISIDGSSETIKTLFFYASFYIFMASLFVITFRFYEWILLHFHPNLKKHISVTLMKFLMSHSHSLYQNNFSGSLANKINDVANGIPHILNTFIDRFFSHILALLIASYAVWFVGLKFAIGFIVWAVVFLIVSFKLSSKAKVLSNEAAEVRSTVIGNIIDILSNMLNVRLFGREKFEINYLSNTIEKSVQAEQKRDKFFMKLNTFQGISFVTFQLICFWWLILGIQSRTVTPGDFALILMLNVSIVDCLRNLSRDLREFAEFFGNVTQGLSIIFSPVEIKDKHNAKSLLIKKGEILFENVFFHYKGSEPLFENISIRIQAGQKIGLVGYSGSGKSTFVSLILRLFDVAQGRILIDDQDIRGVTQNSLRQSITMISQDPSLFHRSLMENIRYGQVLASDKEVIKAAEQACADDFIDGLAEGYQSLIGERGIKLSVGERQRIAIARAILKNSPIFILDEATSQLDSVTEELIQKSLKSLIKEKTTIIIAHRLSTLLHMDRILVFDKGKIVQDGTHRDLLSQSGLYKTLWDAQTDGFLPKNQDSVDLYNWKQAYMK